MLSMDIGGSPVRGLIKWSVPYLNLVPYARSRSASEIRNLESDGASGPAQGFTILALRAFESLSRFCGLEGSIEQRDSRASFYIADCPLFYQYSSPRVLNTYCFK